ncbi:MAG: type III pantothenate kinase [Desulfovibrionaceae bacterium]|nr:type III pantothenate kinase [Desulfovibrionaceae bacterium]
MALALLLDIGNTNIKLGIADRGEISHSFSLPSGRSYTADYLGLLLLQFFGQAHCPPEKLETAIACSVVPSLEPILRQACRKYLRQELLLVPQDLPIPLENRYEEPSQVGADRLVAAYAARRLYADPASIICVDYGTATTFDCVEGQVYLGGLICPGLFSSAAALSSNTAKLPAVSLEMTDPELTPGRSTSTSINHGFIFGFAAMTEGLCARLSKRMAQPCFVLATGGFSSSLSRVMRCFDAVHPELLLEGLRILYVQAGKEPANSTAGGAA